MSKILLTEEEINQTNKNIAGLILRYRKLDENDIFVCLLSGGVFFFTDIVRELYKQDESAQNIKLAFMKTKTYVSNGCAADKVMFEYSSLDDDLEGKRIWLVDDICDSGKTMSALIDYFRDERNFKGDLNIVVFGVREHLKFDKPSAYHSEFIAGKIFAEGDWLVGYGLDDGGTKRNLPFISAL